MRKQITAVGSSIKSFFGAVCDLVFPNTCMICEFLVDRKKLLCPSCMARLKPLASLKIGTISTGFEVFSRFAYSETMKGLVLSKYSQDISVLLKAGRLLHTSPGLCEAMKSQEVDGWIIVPVPLHWTRQLKRGFNQAQVLAQGLAKETGSTVENILYRRLKTKFQSETECKTERTKNVSGAFDLNVMPIIGRTKKTLAEKVAGKGVILVDDLVTTGSTLLECAKVLRKELGATKIIAVTLCRS